jgi:hypothetical protein
MSRIPPAPRPPPGNEEPKPAPQHDRLAHLEAAVERIEQTLAVQFTRIAEIQADLDLIKASNTHKRK